MSFHPPAEILSLSKRKMLWILLIIGSVLHFVGLSKPESVVFDEFHFGKFASNYCCTGSNFFDVHPPHSKLLIAAAAKIGGYDGKFDFSQIGKPYGDTPIFALRFFPAVWGVLIPIAFFYLIALLGGSLPAAFLGGLLLVFDNAILLQTRIIILDGLLMLSILSSLVFYLISRNQKSWRKRILFWSLTGFAAGLAVGTKFTGLVAPALLLILIAADFRKELRLSFLGRKILWIGSGFIFTYLLGWILHFYLLDLPGPGDKFYKTTGNTPVDIVKLHSMMLDRNLAITTKHPDSSLWWQWPAMKRPLFYWSAPDGAIYFIGNPVVWWGSTFFLLFLIVALVFYRDWSRRFWLTNPNIGLCVSGLLIAYIPLTPITRPMFLYHFLTPLLFSLLICILGLDATHSILFRSKRIYFSLIGTTVACFIFIAPVTLGWSKQLTWSSTVVKLVNKLH